MKRTCPGCGCEVEAKSAKGPSPRCVSCRKACGIEGCGKPSAARGWCITHYTRWAKHGDATITLKGGPRSQSGCAVDGCLRKHNRGGYCRLHFDRFRKHGDPLHKRTTADRCGFDECIRPIGDKGGKGFCSLHFKRLTKYGDARGVSLGCGICGTTFFPVNSLRKVCDPCMETCIRPHYISVAELAQRDGTRCGLCDEAVDMTLAWPDPWSPTVDHIIPWSLGGTHARENLQLAHFRCNARKGNRITP